MSRSKFTHLICQGSVVLVLFAVVAVIGVQTKKIPYGKAGYELGDYRLKGGEPFVTLFEHENYRGKIFRQKVGKACTNIPYQYQEWTSSIILHQRCIVLCEELNCQGPCQNIYPNQKGVKRLSDFQLNDKAKSLKFCYRF